MSDAAPRRRYRYYREASPAIILVGALILYGYGPRYLEAREREGWARVDVTVTAASARQDTSRWNAFWNRMPEEPGDGPGDAARAWRVALNYEFKDAGGTTRRGEGEFGAFRRAEAERVAADLLRGRRIEAWVDPANPDRSALERPPLGPVTFSCGVGLLLILLGGGIFLSVAFAQHRPDDDTPDWAALPR